MPKKTFTTEQNVRKVRVQGFWDSGANLWLKRIKAALDPQMACDPFFFIKGIQPERTEDNSPPDERRGKNGISVM